MALTILLSAACSPPLQTGGVMSLHDTTTEIVVGLGQAHQLRAVMQPEFLSDTALHGVQDIPRVSAPVSKEWVLARAPDVVLGTEDVPQHQPELANLGGAVWIDPVGLDGLWNAVTTVAEALGVSPEPYLSTLKQQVPKQQIGGFAELVPVFVYDCCEPPFTLGGRAPLTELLTYIGAKNIFSDLDQDWASVSWEAARARAPLMLILTDYDGEGEVAEKRAVVLAKFGDIPTVVLPLGLALEGPRTLGAAGVLLPALQSLQGSHP